jgi:hypothetical protein
MSAAQIQAEIEAALREVARDTGDGEFLVTLTEPSTGPVTPWSSTSPTAGAKHEVPAMIGRFSRNMIDGTLIRATDKRVMIAGTAPKPLTSWRVTIAGQVHSIVNVMELAPAGEPLYFEVQARA